MRRTLIAMTALLALTATTPAGAVIVGSKGNLYPIAEKDAALELQEKMASIDWKKETSKIRSEADSYRPPGTRKLPTARTSKSRLVDMVYTLQQDVPDGKGGVLYPKGFTFNPLDYISYPLTIVVIDATSKEQVSWFMSSKYVNDLNVKLLLTDGSAMQFSDKYDRDVAYADGLVIKRFKLKAVPSIIKQKGRMMEVSEVAVHGSKN